MHLTRPDGISAARRGAWEHAPSHVIDVLPTLLDIVSSAGGLHDLYPAEPVPPMEGTSLLPLLVTATPDGSDVLRQVKVHTNQSNAPPDVDATSPLLKSTLY